VQLLVAGPDALDIPAEQVYDVAPLDLTATVELFQAWVEYIRPTLDITANDEAAIEAICQRLAGLPLAVELVASRVDRYEPSTMLEQLTQFGLDLAHGQPSLQKVLEWSYEQLTAEEKAVLQRLSVFASTFDYKAVLSLGLGFEQRGLVRKGLVQQQPPVEGEGRFLLPTVVREFGLAKLAATGESNLKHRDHAQYYYDRARRHVPAPHLPRSASQERVWRQSLKPELNNLRSAMRWCFSEGGEAVLGVQIGNALGRYWAISGRWTEGRKWLTEALAQSSIPAAEQAEAHRHLARLDKLEGDNDSARQHLTDSLALYQQATERWSEAVSQYELSEVALDQGEYDQARQFATDSLTTFTEMDDRHYMALALIQLAQVALDRDRDSSRAADLFEEALQRLAELPPSDVQAETWNRLGLVELELDRGEYAQLHFRQALEHFLYVADDAGMGRAFYGLGLAELIDQRPNRAAAQFNSALKRCLQGEDKVGVVLAVEGLAGAAAPQQDYQRMARLLGASHAHRQSLAMGSKPNKLAVSEADLAAAQADLRDRWLAVRANGERMSFEQMVREALSQA
jgi:tetratricopeptide (TPR) repeat protein